MRLPVETRVKMSTYRKITVWHNIKIHVSVVKPWKKFPEFIKFKKIFFSDFFIVEETFYEQFPALGSIYYGFLGSQDKPLQKGPQKVSNPASCFKRGQL